MKYYYGPRNKSNYFEGWYFKHSSKDINIAFIPSISVVNKHERKAFIQVICNAFTERFEFEYSDFKAKSKELYIKIKDNIFSDKGITLNLINDRYNIKVDLQYSSFLKIKNDIMGPFKYFPLMECVHKIYSMKHLVNGVITINNKEYAFKDDLGYLEGDYGVSFPNKYIWVQANNLDDGAFFLSVATIPYCKLKFTGLIASLIIGQKEYRFATYNLAKILINTKDHIRIKKRKFVLDVYMKDSDKLVLAAPKNGDMTRLVHESMEAEIEILLTENGNTIFKNKASNASIEMG